MFTDTSKVLAATMYDPATEVFISLSGGQFAMTAFDTTNLRLTFTAPTSGRVRVKLALAARKSLTADSFHVFLGVLDGSTVKVRIPCFHGPLTSNVGTISADAVVSALTPGQSYTWDAAYGSEDSLTGAIAYGGPNNATEQDASGGFYYEISEA